jgi:hypothetical protein
MGIDQHTKAYLVFDPLNDEVIITEHVKFNELVQGIRDVNNITVVNLNFQSIKANTGEDYGDKFYSEPFAYFDEEFDDPVAMFQPENGTIIGKNNAQQDRAVISKRIRDKYEDEQVLVIEEKKTYKITLGSLQYEEDYTDPNDYVVDFDLANQFFRTMYIESSEESINDLCFKAEERINLQDALKGSERDLWKKSIQEEYDGQDRLNSFTIDYKNGQKLLDWLLVFKRKYKG